MRNRVHRERHTLKENTATTGENQTEQKQGGSGPRLLFSPQTRSSQTAGWVLSSHSYRQQQPYQNKALLPISQPIYSPAGSRPAPFICRPSHVRGSIWDCGEATLHARRFPSNALSQDDSDQMCLPLELWCFFIRTMLKGESVRGKGVVKNAGSAAHAGSTALFYRLL